MEWFNYVWGPNSDDVRRLLVIDQAPIHKTKVVADAAENTETDIGFIPAGCTGILQPADVYWIKYFKSCLRRSWKQFIMKGEKTPMGNSRKPSRQDELNFVSEAWSAVPEEVIQWSFKGRSINTALNGTEDGELHDRLAGIATPPATVEATLEDECMNLIFCSDSKESFNGVSDCDY